jgi:hypothetical protein
VPDPIIDVRSTGANKITLVVPGYVAVAQGRIRVDGLNNATKNIHDIEFLGGVLAARIDIAYPPDSMRLELLNPVIQKTIRLVTTLSGSVPVEGVAILQINDNNAWALNSWVVQ